MTGAGGSWTASGRRALSTGISQPSGHADVVPDREHGEVPDPLRLPRHEGQHRTRVPPPPRAGDARAAPRQRLVRTIRPSPAPSIKNWSLANAKSSPAKRCSTVVRDETPMRSPPIAQPPPQIDVLARHEPAVEPDRQEVVSAEHGGHEPEPATAAARAVVMGQGSTPERRDHPRSRVPLAGRHSPQPELFQQGVDGAWRPHHVGVDEHDPRRPGPLGAEQARATGSPLPSSLRTTAPNRSATSTVASLERPSTTMISATPLSLQRSQALGEERGGVAGRNDRSDLGRGGPSGFNALLPGPLDARPMSCTSVSRWSTMSSDAWSAESTRGTRRT